MAQFTRLVPPTNWAPQHGRRPPAHSGPPEDKLDGNDPIKEREPIHLRQNATKESLRFVFGVAVGKAVQIIDKSLILTRRVRRAFGTPVALSETNTLQSKFYAKEPRLTKMVIHTDVSPVQSTLSTEDGRGLHVRRWGSPSADVAIVVVHGLGEHSGCYAEFGEFMAERGFLVYASDQHGHGKSPGVRGHAPAIETYIDDIQTVCFYVVDHHPDAEIVLLGHSMGGHMVLRFLLDKDRPPIERAIVTNPMILPQNPPTKLQSFAAWLTSKMIPRVRVTAKQPPTQLTQDPEMLQQLADDPLLHEKLSIGIGGELMSSGHRILDSADQLKSDLLFLIGGDDDICDRETSQEFCRLVGRRCTTKLFDGLRHSLLIEKDRHTVYETIIQWLS